MPTVVITGASGFLGKACCEAFAAAGYSVRALVREPRAGQTGFYQADLPSRIDPRAFEGDIAAVIHCAYSTKSASEEESRSTNIAGTEALLKVARKSVARQFIFVSSLAAHQDARSVYGRTKWELEQLFTSPGDAIVKPGTIIGNGGIFERTRELIRKLPAIPLLFGDKALQTVWIGDVCQGILAMVQQAIEGSVILAHPTAVPMREFYRGIAEADGIAAKFIPIPGDLALSAVSIAERLGLRLPITSENLLGIKYIHYFDPSADLARLRIQPLDFAQSLEALKLNPKA